MPRGGARARLAALAAAAAGTALLAAIAAPAALVSAQPSGVGAPTPGPGDDYPVRSVVTELPGVGKPLAELGLRMWTGFVDGGDAPDPTKGALRYFYWCADTLPSGNASSTSSSPGEAHADRPLVFWFNGGPGASSLFGLLNEWGPLLVTTASFDTDEYVASGVATPTSNPHSWVNVATVCAFDSPPPMGFSFCTAEGPSAGLTSCGPWSDSTVAAGAREAFGSFFSDAFPEWRNRRFYLAGESYAGMYVPLFAEQIMDNPIPDVTLNGWAVGDGWTGCQPEEGRPVDWCINLTNVGTFQYPNTNPGPYYDALMMGSHGQISQTLYRNIMANCSQGELFGEVMPLGAQCQELIDEMAEQVGYFYVYNLINACVPGGSPFNANNSEPFICANPEEDLPCRLGRRNAVRSASPGNRDGGVGSPCLANAIGEYLALNATLTAISVPLDASFNNADNAQGFTYIIDRPFVGPIYSRGIEEGMKILIYEGDIDASGLSTVPLDDVWTPYFAQAGIPLTQPWRPFKTNPGVQGAHRMAWADGNVSFISIRGSGHMVPLDRPVASLETMRVFLLNVTADADVSDLLAAKSEQVFGVYVGV